MYKINHVNDIREEFTYLLKNDLFITDKSGVKTIEIRGASFVADAPLIFGSLNRSYADREIEWYNSESRNVNDIPGGPPAIWTQVASTDGTINSNYGWCIFNQHNYNQYNNVLAELKKNLDTRRAVMIYTRPSMWYEYDINGRSDFMCTNAVQYLNRYGKLDAIVQMRSNDAIFGYKNDYHWQKYVLDKLSKELNIPPGRIFWQVGSLHVYERHFHLIT